MRWRNDTDDPRYDPDFPTGMGMMFIDLPPEHQPKILDRSLIDDIKLRMGKYTRPW